MVQLWQPLGQAKATATEELNQQQERWEEHQVQTVQTDILNLAMNITFNDKQQLCLLGPDCKFRPLVSYVAWRHSNPIKSNQQSLITANKPPSKHVGQKRWNPHHLSARKCAAMCSIFALTLATSVHSIHLRALRAMNSTPGPPVAPGTVELAGGPKLSRSEARRLKEEEQLAAALQLVGSRLERCWKMLREIARSCGHSLNMFKPFTILVIMESCRSGFTLVTWDASEGVLSAALDISHSHSKCLCVMKSECIAGGSSASTIPCRSLEVP